MMSIVQTDVLALRGTVYFDTTTLRRTLAGASVLVTGSQGFIGNHLTMRLAAEGSAVTGIDVRPGGNAPRVETIIGDVRGLTADVLTDRRPSAIFHLASVVGVAAAAADPHRTRANILEGTRSVLRAAIEAGAPDFVYFSSSEVYGAGRNPLAETSPLGPTSPYGHAKAASERLVRDYASQTGAIGLIIRPFNVYGPGQRKDFVIPSFVRSALLDEPLTIVGDGEQTRTFTYIDDLIEGVLTIYKRVMPGPDVFNLAGAGVITIRRLARMVVEVVGAGEPVVGVAPEALGRPQRMEIRHRVPSTAAAAGLGFEPQVTLQTGLCRVLAALRQDTRADAVITLASPQSTESLEIYGR